MKKRYKKLFESRSSLEKDLEMLFTKIYKKYKKYETSNKSIPRGGNFSMGSSGEINFLYDTIQSRSGQYSQQQIDFGIKVGSNVDRKIGKEIQLSLEKGVMSILNKYEIPSEVRKNSWTGNNISSSECFYSSWGGTNWTLYFLELK